MSKCLNVQKHTVTTVTVCDNDNILWQWIQLTKTEKSQELMSTFTLVGVTNLPLADALHSNSKGPLQTSAKLKGITANLNDVVDESTHGSQREGWREEHHVAKLDKHLLVVLEGVLRRTEWIIGA